MQIHRHHSVWSPTEICAKESEGCWPSGNLLGKFHKTFVNFHAFWNNLQNLKHLNLMYSSFNLINGMPHQTNQLCYALRTALDFFFATTANCLLLTNMTGLYPGEFLCHYIFSLAMMIPTIPWSLALLFSEMIEHVGHEFMEEFFGCCESVLAEDGILVLQVNDRGKLRDDILSHFLSDAYVMVA